MGKWDPRCGDRVCAAVTGQDAGIMGLRRSAAREAAHASTGRSRRVRHLQPGSVHGGVPALAADCQAVLARDVGLEEGALLLAALLGSRHTGHGTLRAGDLDLEAAVLEVHTPLAA